MSVMIYDIANDERRKATQEDVDLIQRIAGEIANHRDIIRAVAFLNLHQDRAKLEAIKRVLQGDVTFATDGGGGKLDETPGSLPDFTRPQGRARNT